MKHEGAERERDVTGGHYNSGVVGSRTRSNGSLIFPLYICSLRCFIFFFGFHKCKYFTVQNDKCIFVDEEDVARRDVYIGPSRTVAPSTQNKKTGSSTSFSYSRKRFSVGISRVCVAPPVVAKSHEMPTKNNNNIRPVVCPPKRNKQMEKTKHTETLVVFDPPVEMIALRAIVKQ